MSCNQGLVKVWYQVDFMMDRLAGYNFDLDCNPEFIALDLQTGKIDVIPCKVHGKHEFTSFLSPGDRFQVSACLMFDPSFEVQ